MLMRIAQILTVTASFALAVASAAIAQPRPLPSDVGPVEASGAFVVQSCGETGSAEGWTESVNDNRSALASGVDCPPSRLAPGGTAVDFQQAGIWASDRLGRDAGVDATPGDRVELAFRALPGTVVNRVRWWRSIFKQLDGNWQPYTEIEASPAIRETCVFPQGNHSCGVGGTDWIPYDVNFNNNVLSYADVSGFSAEKIVVGVSCGPNDDGLCADGFSLPRAEVQILSAFLTIADGGAPVVDGVSGDGWTRSGWSQGSLPLVVASRDVTGIAATKVYADGSLIATVQRTCRYDRPRPCSNDGGGAVGIPTVGLADGAHQIDVGVVDAASNETRVRRTVPLLVDNDAPAAPVGIGSPQATSNANDFSVAWSLPVDGGTPITAARYQVCQSGSCGEVRTAPSTTRIDDLALSATGPATVRVWLEDQLGHADPESAATLALTYTAPPPSPPAPPDPRDEPQQAPGEQPLTPGLPGCLVSCGTAPPTQRPPATQPKKVSPALKLTTLRRVRRRVTVAGTVGARASGSVTVRYRVRIRGRARTLTKRVRIARRGFRTTLVLSSTLAAARSATVSVAYAGDPDTVPQTRTATVHTRA
jgi:hypothetical protein